MASTVPLRSAAAAPAAAGLRGPSLRAATNCGVALPSRRRNCKIVMATAGGAESDADTGGFGMVDANMMVLRRRIEGLRVKEDIVRTPQEWMEWEKTCYESYRVDVCLFLRSIEEPLLSMRPGVALSLVSLILAILPVASVLFVSALVSQISAMGYVICEHSKF